MADLLIPAFRDFHFFIYIIISLQFLIPHEILCASPTQLSPCKKEDFSYKILPCDPVIRKRKAVHYMSKSCDLKANGSADFPQPITDIPCKCQPGFGENMNENGNVKCEKCKAGTFSHGGELIDNWKNWNGTKGVPGSGYDVYPYCSDFLTGRNCETWKPSGGNMEYIISGNMKNHSLELKCFEQSILVLRRVFVGGLGENKIRFKFKVEGAPCRRGSSVCSNGLYFYVNGVKKMKKDVQFMWKEFSTDVNAGGNEFKFIYHRSCVKEEILDVAFIKHISMIGTETPNTTCSDCPPGTYSKTPGSSECVKCLQNTYQDKAGQISCKECPKGYFSRIGATQCMKLPKCTKDDYYVLPDTIDKCFMKNGKWFRKQKVLLANWPGKTKYSCIDSDKKPAGEDIQCQCQPGEYLDVMVKPSCEKCPAGTYSDGSFLKCKSCPNGAAAVPGFYYKLMTSVALPDVSKVTCSGQYCNGVSNGKDGKYWLPRGDHIATKRLPGNFELKTEYPVVEIKYHLARISYKCAVDCRMHPNTKRLAKHDHCFFKIVLKQGNETIKADDCVNHYRPQLRNGTKISHVIPLKKPGNYSFYTVFHHEDEGNLSLVSYEARLYDIQLFGSTHGSAKNCVACKAGTRLSDDKRFCIKCPKGTFSKNASSDCTPCPENHFSDKEGSAGCKPCGTGTISNSQKDGCDYRGCKYSPSEGIHYDLSALKADGGPMYQVRTYAKEVPYQYPLLYYINICSHNHDNSSCMMYKRKMNMKTRKVQIYEKTYLRTMACKRWAFDRYNSYSIGEVLSFYPWKENITRGLMLNLTGGFKCYHKVYNKYVMPSTSILMECDLNAGEGHPEPLSNFTAIDEKHCQYELRWRSYYACRLCTGEDYTTVMSKCINGTMTMSQKKTGLCRSPHDVDQLFSKRVKCKEPITQTPLIITVIVAIFLIGILVVFLLYYIRRARARNGNIFQKSFHKVQEEDEDELVDNMQTLST